MTLAGHDAAQPASSDPRLAATYDVFEGPRDDLDLYEGLVEELAAGSVLDIGCGTGDFACRLARDGIGVTAVDPDAAAVEIARSKPDADLVRWVVGTAEAVGDIEVDLVTMTANVAQVFVTDEAWRSTLSAAHHALRGGGYLVFESRVPEQRAWEEWTPALTRTRATLSNGEVVETWCELLSVEGDVVSFRWSTVFSSDGAMLTSDTELR